MIIASMLLGSQGVEKNHTQCMHIRRRVCTWCLKILPLESSKARNIWVLVGKSTKCNQMIRFSRKESSPLQLRRFSKSFPLRGLQVFSFSVCCISLVTLASAIVHGFHKENRHVFVECFRCPGNLVSHYLWRFISREMRSQVRVQSTALTRSMVQER